VNQVADEATIQANERSEFRQLGCGKLAAEFRIQGIKIASRVVDEAVGIAQGQPLPRSERRVLFECVQGQYFCLR